MENTASLPGTYVILVVEDEALIRMLTVQALTDAGFSVLEAGHAAGALELLWSGTPGIHAVLTDVRMPGEMDGIMLAHEARRSWPWIHLVVTSASPIAADAELPEQSWFFPKPYDVNAVADHLHDRLVA